MLQGNQPGSWGKRIIHASLLLIGLAVAAHIIDEVLLPLLPVILAVLGLAALLLALRSRRWR